MTYGLYTHHVHQWNGGDPAHPAYHVAVCTNDAQPVTKVYSYNRPAQANRLAQDLSDQYQLEIFTTGE